MSLLDPLLAVARGDTPADLLLRGGRVVNVFTGEIERADIAVWQGVIVSVGPEYEAKKVIDLNGAFVAPGLIDSHVHIESSLCTPRHFANAVLPRGVTTVVTDPHEIANVCGVAGVRYMAEASRQTALNVIVMAPSCVPATDMATAGATIGADDIAALIDDDYAYGLAEVMNFPGVIASHRGVRSKLAVARSRQRPMDGHCPGVRGKALNAYAITGIGSDHESITPDEAREKLSRGLYLLIREATNARNLDALLPVVTPKNCRRVCFCTDDRTPTDLLESGTIDMMVRRAIAGGMDPIDALRCATLNTAEWFGLKHVGAIAPGRRADLIVFDDLNDLRPRCVFCAGIDHTEWPGFDRLSAATEHPAPPKSRCVVEINETTFDIAARGTRVRVIGAIADQLVTQALVIELAARNGHLDADISRDVLKMAVMERHGKNGNVGLGFVQGVGLKRGAIAGTVAHDHHNLVVIGADDESMRTAAREVARLGGGIVVADVANVVASLALEVAGLMTDRPARDVAKDYKAVVAAAKTLGATANDPFMAMSFLALEVIPSLKLTDQGLIDIDTFRLVDLFIE